MKNKFKGGIFNPLNCQKACFQYEVEETGEVKNVEYPDGEGGTYTQQERDVLLKLAGRFIVRERILCTLCGDDALKPLREGELITAKLQFGVKMDNNGKYEQYVIAEDVFTLNDYYQIREADAHWNGQHQE